MNSEAHVRKLAAQARYRAKNREALRKKGREYVAANRERRRQYYLSNKDKILATCSVYYQENKERICARVWAWKRTPTGRMSVRRANAAVRVREPIKARARQLIHQQTRYAGIKLPCSVCSTTEDVHAHHEDYTKPLDVIWLCRKHHQERHKQSGNDTLSLSPTKGDTHA